MYVNNVSEGITNVFGWYLNVNLDSGVNTNGTLMVSLLETKIGKLIPPINSDCSISYVSAFRL